MNFMRRCLLDIFFFYYYIDMKTLNEYIRESLLDDEEELIGRSIEDSEINIIEEWCKEHKIYNGNFKINSKKEIEPVNLTSRLVLDYEDYDELPKYIKFASHENLDLTIGVSRLQGMYSNKKISIKSFRGLPEQVRYLNIKVNLDYFPELKITCNGCWVNIYSAIKGIEKMKLDFKGRIIKELHIRSLGVRADRDYNDFSKMFELKDVERIDFVNDMNFGDSFSKAIARKAPMNKYKNKFENPITEEGLEVINTYFGKNNDIKNLKNIQYTQNSQLIKHSDGKWYRFKNWT